MIFPAGMTDFLELVFYMNQNYSIMNFYPTYIGFSYPSYKCYITYAKSNPKTILREIVNTLTNILFEIG